MASNLEGKENLQRVVWFLSLIITKKRVFRFFPPWFVSHTFTFRFFFSTVVTHHYQIHFRRLHHLHFNTHALQSDQLHLLAKHRYFHQFVLLLIIVRRRVAI